MIIKKNNLIEGKTIGFYHIPKTGGTSIVRSLADYFIDDQKRSGYGLIRHRRNNGRITETNEYTRLVFGHYFYTAPSVFRLPHFTFTVLRDPIDRVMSLNRFRGKCAGSMPNDILGGVYESHNGMTRRMAGCGMKKMYVDNQDLELAKRNLKSLSFVGFTHDISRVALALSDAIGITLEIGHENTSEITSDTHCEDASQIDKNNPYDIELYQWALDEFSGMKHLGWRSPTTRGLGDTFKAVTDKLGIKQCGGCKKNQNRLNELVSYKGAQDG